VTQLWVTIPKGTKALAGSLEEGSSKSEADAQLESILGRAWKLFELKEAGYWVTDRTLVELAHERADDPVRGFVTASGYLLDLGDGSVVREWTGLPVAALRFAKLRASRGGVLSVKEAALYPGDIVNRRIRWDEDSAKDVVSERPREASDYAQLHALASPLEPLLKALKTQLKNPLNPSDAVGLLAARRFGTAGDTLVAEDAAGGRLVIRDPKKASFATTRNLRYAVGAFGPGSLAVRLYFDLRERAIFGQALALIVGDKHIRLGV
jgi:hypothetical protein